MLWKRVRSLIFIFILCSLAFMLTPPPAAQGGVNIYASPVQAGCYMARQNQCKIHVDPFTLNLAAGEKLVYFQLMARRISNGNTQVIYDFRPDASNPVPFDGDSYTPSAVKKDFAATCGESYIIYLQGQDTGDPNPYNLGATEQFSCMAGSYNITLPLVRR